MATIEPELAAALNTLLEGERASVEMEVALASGATEFMERETLTVMGCDDLSACCALHEYLERREAPVSWRTHAAVYSVLNEVRYDDRLRAFAAHQRAVGEHAESLIGEGQEADLIAILDAIRQAHSQHILWSEKRADEFAATRQLDYRTPAGRVLLRRPVGGAPEAELASTESFPNASTTVQDGDMLPYPPGEEHATRPMSHYPEVPGTGSTQTIGGDEADERLPGTTLE
jgi:hypothetical protein